MKAWIEGFLSRTVLVLFLFVNVPVPAAEVLPDQEDGQNFLPANHFAQGRYEAALTSGALFSPFVATHRRPVIDYTLTGLQVGFMLGDAHASSSVRGNFEFAADTFGSAIFEGSGTYIAGETFWLRYNWLPRKPCGLVPYAQGGTGFVFTDIDRGIVGQRFNFNLDLGIGARYFFTRQCSLDLEYRYQHISNADLGRHNLGINAHGPILGVSYFF